MPSNRCGVIRVDRVVVNKSRREMLLLRGESVLRSYRIALGRDPLGPKAREGDGKTPEGHYVIDRRNPRGHAASAHGRAGLREALSEQFAQREDFVRRGGHEGRRWKTGSKCGHRNGPRIGSTLR